MQGSDVGFLFGIEAEFLLVDKDSYRPLWHQDLSFKVLNEMLESIPVDDMALESFKIEPPHRKPMPYVVEGYHLPDPNFKPIDLLPKGVEIRTPTAPSIPECVRLLEALHGRLQPVLNAAGYHPVATGFHPIADGFQGPQNKRRHDFWQWAMEAMATYGPDLSVRLSDRVPYPSASDLYAKVNFYGPAITALTLSTPLCHGDLWRIRGRTGKSIRTYHRSVIAPAIEIHPDQDDRLEFKLFDTPWCIGDYDGLFLLWLELLLDPKLRGRATNETRVYDLGAVARLGLEAETVRDRAQEVLEQADSFLPEWGFDTAGLDTFKTRLNTGRLPADEIITLYEQNHSIEAVLRQLTLRRQ